MIALYEPMLALGARLLAQVHDSLVFEVPEARAEEAKALLTEIMPGPYMMQGHDRAWSFPVEAKIGRFWSDV
jgi:DNA polymerase I-like protein with 3'-5' exonuclease and polymerase domains